MHEGGIEHVGCIGQQSGKVTAVGWIEDRWHALTGVGSGTWLAIAMWVAVAVGLAALLYAHRQLKRNRALRLEQMRPHVAMFMEPHASDWHLVELVVKNYGQTAAHNVSFSFENPPTVAQYENEHNGLVGIAELALPSEIPVLAPGQEWRTGWDCGHSPSALPVALPAVWKKRCRAAQSN